MLCTSYTGYDKILVQHLTENGYSLTSGLRKEINPRSGMRSRAGNQAIDTLISSSTFFTNVSYNCQQVFEQKPVITNSSPQISFLNI